MRDGPKLLLASGSPRRSAMLAAAGYEFEVAIPGIDETVRPGEGPAALAVRLAAVKAREAGKRAGPEFWVLGVDTVVAVDDLILGKPADEAEAVRMLLALSGRTHAVWSGFVLSRMEEETTGVEETRVTMRVITRLEAEEYAVTGEPLDKAGAYAIQGGAIRFITAVEGSRHNVMGLPLETLEPRLKELGIMPARRE